MMNRHHCFYALTLEILNFLCGILIFVRNILYVLGQKLPYKRVQSINVYIIYSIY